MIAEHRINERVNEMNTIFAYLYRDSSNYKQFHHENIKGELKLEQIKPYLYEGSFFIPSQLGMEDLEFDEYDDEEDHVWHEIDELTLTEKEPTLRLTAEETVKAFKDLHATGWNLSKVLEQRGLS